jgi:hypothetical protein
MDMSFDFFSCLEAPGRDQLNLSVEVARPGPV